MRPVGFKEIAKAASDEFGAEIKENTIKIFFDWLVNLYAEHKPKYKNEFIKDRDDLKNNRFIKYGSSRGKSIDILLDKIQDGSIKNIMDKPKEEWERVSKSVTPYKKEIDAHYVVPVGFLDYTKILNHYYRASGAPKVLEQELKNFMKWAIIKLVDKKQVQHFKKAYRELKHGKFTGYTGDSKLVDTMIESAVRRKEIYAFKNWDKSKFLSPRSLRFVASSIKFKNKDKDTVVKENITYKDKYIKERNMNFKDKVREILGLNEEDKKKKKKKKLLPGGSGEFTGGALKEEEGDSTPGGEAWSGGSQKKGKGKKKAKKVVKEDYDEDEDDIEEATTEGGYQAMASSVGSKKGTVKEYLKSKKMKSTMMKVKKEASKKGIKDKNAYIYGTERKILKQHLAK
jgi:hypothetical protein